MTSLTDLYIEYDPDKYTDESLKGYQYAQVAADENLVDKDANLDDNGTYHHAMFAKWEAQQVNYTVEYYYMDDNGAYPASATSSDTRQAKTDTTVSVTGADKTPSDTSKYALDASDTYSADWSDTVAGNGSTVLKVYFKLNTATVTVHHYLKGTTTKVAEDVTDSARVGSTYTAAAATTFLDVYTGKTLTAMSPIQTITVDSDAEKNVVNVYYTLPLTITAASDKKVYDSKPLTKNEANPEEGQLLAGDTIKSVTVTGSQTLVGSSSNIPSDAIVVTGKTEDSEGTVVQYYTITYANGTLTVTDGTKPEEEDVDDDLVVTKTADEGPYALGATVTFNITATNIYDAVSTIVLTEIDNVTLAQSSFENVAAGETIRTTATYTIVEADILKNSFTNIVTAAVGALEKTASATVDTEEKNGHLTVTKVTTSETPEDGYALGDEITYKITVTNDGNLTITDITVTDELT